MIVDKAIYRDGEREEIDRDISEAFERAKARGDSFLWIGLVEPTHEEFDLIVDELKLQPLEVGEIMLFIGDDFVITVRHGATSSTTCCE